MTLSPDEVAAIEVVGQRLHSELSRLVRWIPSESRSVRTMAAYLGVDRNTCQRVVSAVQPAASGCEAFVRLPGIKPLRDLVRRAREKGAPEDLVASLTAAVERLQLATEEFDESHARLKSRIEATIAAGAYQTDRGELDIRRSLFEENARLLSRQMRLHSLITAIGPHADDPLKIEQAWVRGLVGLRLGSGAPPLPLGIASTDRASTLSGPAATFNPLKERTAPGERASRLIPSLSSTPLPTLTTRGPAGSQVTVLDPAGAGETTGVDAAIATRISHVSHPKRQSPEIFHTSSVMLTPAAKLVFDVYLHRSLAIASVPSCGVFQYTMAFSEDIGENWPFRLPGQYRLEMLGAGLEHADHDGWSKHRLAAELLFDQTGWSANDYIGHRLTIDYPLWGSTVYQWFDFRLPDATEGTSGTHD